MNSRLHPLLARLAALSFACWPLIETTPVHAQAGGASPVQAAPAAQAAAPATNPHATNPHATNPHANAALGSGGDNPKLQVGSPFANALAVQQALAARAGQVFQPATKIETMAQLPKGTIVVVLRNPDGTPIGSREVRLDGVRESIREGDKSFVHHGTTDSEGRAGFLQLQTDSSYRYELSVAHAGATYKSDSFRLKSSGGTFVGMTLFPTTERMEETFVVSRALYIIEPRNEIFQIQVLFRLYNTNPITWLPREFSIPLPAEASAFRPMRTSGDIQVRHGAGNSLRISGTVTPGEHELSFGFQLPNPGSDTADLALPVIPNTVDTRIFLERSKTMNLSVAGFGAPAETTGNDGQAAIFVQKDFLRPAERGPNEYIAHVTGLPTRGRGPLVAATLAGAFALAGLWLARKKPPRGLLSEDAAQAEKVLLNELLAVERAKDADEIGPKTYERTHQMLLEALARVRLLQRPDS